MYNRINPPDRPPETDAFQYYWTYRPDQTVLPGRLRPWIIHQMRAYKDMGRQEIGHPAKPEGVKNGEKHIVYPTEHKDNTMQRILRRF